MPSDVAIDHEARREIAVIRTRQDSHEKFCEERARKSEIFETEMRTAIHTVSDKISKGNERIHTRLDSMWKGGLVFAFGIILSAGGWFLITLWKQSGGV